MSCHWGCSQHRTLSVGLVILSLMCVINSSVAQQQNGPSHQPVPKGWPEFVRLFDSSMDDEKIVGASVLMIENGVVVARHDHGLADRATGQPVNERTIFHYGSITKILTAISIMQLRDRQ